jgi:peptide deformylase
MILPIYKYGSHILRKNALDIDKGDLFKKIAQNMALTLKKADGIGLAGPQVGALKNIFIIDTTSLTDKGIKVVEKTYINPVILHYGEENIVYAEGCLSIPGIIEEVLRPEKIEVRYRDENFDWQEEVLDGIIARIFLHEFDHLQGTLFVDRINPLRKKLVRMQLREIQRAHYRKTDKP